MTKFLDGKILAMTVLFAILIGAAISPAFAALSVTTTKLKLTIAGGPAGNEKVEWDGSMTTTPETPISPGTQDVFFELSTDNIDKGKVKFYGVSLPHGSLASNDGIFYELTDSAKQQSGLEVFKMIRSADGSWNVSLKDAHTTVPSQNYHNTCVDLRIGDETGQACSTLVVKNNNNWMTT